MNYSINLDGCGLGGTHSFHRVSTPTVTMSIKGCSAFQDRRTKTLRSKSKTFEEDNVDEWHTQVESVTRLCRKRLPRLFQERVLDLAWHLDSGSVCPTLILQSGKKKMKKNQKEEKSGKQLPTLEEAGTTSSTSGNPSEKTFFSLYQFLFLFFAF